MGLMGQDWFGVKKEFLFRAFITTNSAELKESEKMFERFSCTTPTQVALQREPCLLFPISPSHPPEENDKAVQSTNAPLGKTPWKERHSCRTQGPTSLGIIWALGYPPPVDSICYPQIQSEEHL